MSDELNALYRLEHKARFTPERTQQELDARVEVLELDPETRVLEEASFDLATGTQTLFERRIFGRGEENARSRYPTRTS